MIELLQDIWDVTPKALKNANYCFYIGKGYKDVPKKFNNKIVKVVYIIDDFAIYYAPTIFDE